jgi:polynucleotide 5'-hydroxyl-kinase GRC3/NOL9
MLSAFQARRARLAAAPGVQEQTTTVPTAASHDLQSSAPEFTPRRSSRKRKPGSAARNETDQPQRRKKTDDRRFEGKVRYFDAPVDVPNPDLHSSADEDISLSDQEILSQSHSQPQRAWSPSQRSLDSSDGEMERGADGIQPIDAPIAASTVPFSAELDVNTFCLTPEECFALISLKEPATIMILPVRSSVTLTGVYQLTVLQGSVMLMGVTLTSPDTSHTVFSPKLSPLPCIESLGNIETASQSIDHVPDRLRPCISQERAVILIRAHSTGIEGLGRAMRTFEGIFCHSQPNTPTFDLGIAGVEVHMV